MYIYHLYINNIKTPHFPKSIASIILVFYCYNSTYSSSWHSNSNSNSWIERNPTLQLWIVHNLVTHIQEMSDNRLKIRSTQSNKSQKRQTVLKFTARSPINSKLLLLDSKTVHDKTQAEIAHCQALKARQILIGSTPSRVAARKPCRLKLQGGICTHERWWKKIQTWNRKSPAHRSCRAILWDYRNSHCRASTKA